VLTERFLDELLRLHVTVGDTAAALLLADTEGAGATLTGAALEVGFVAVVLGGAALGVVLVGEDLTEDAVWVSEDEGS